MAVTTLDPYHSHRLITAVAEATPNSQEFHNALAKLHTAIGVTDGGCEARHEITWEEFASYDFNARCQVVAEYLRERLEQEGA